MVSKILGFYVCEYVFCETFISPSRMDLLYCNVSTVSFVHSPTSECLLCDNIFNENSLSIIFELGTVLPTEDKML